MSDSKIISRLLFKYMHDDLTPSEQQKLERWKQMSSANLKFFEELTREKIPGSLRPAGRPMGGQQLEKRILQKITTHIPDLSGRVIPIKKTWWKYAAAALIILSLGSARWLFLNYSPAQELSHAEKPVKQDVAAPDGNYASITLANGHKLDLNSSSNGTLASQGKVQLVKLADGLIAYKGASEKINGEMQYNTLTNPKGSRVVTISLEDGSKVWLNAGSSLTYPVAFIGRERKVSITGEAYFEVFRNEAMPFKISKGEMEVQVLGTHFNVNTYQDEPEMKVTLLEGSVKISSGNVSQLLKPGEQARVKDDAIDVQMNADIEEVMAWKNGYFSFEKASVTVVMRQIARWYNVEVNYEGSLPDENFGGELRRNSSLASVLKVLEQSGVKFSIAGNKVTVFK